MLEIVSADLGMGFSEMNVGDGIVVVLDPPSIRPEQDHGQAALAEEQNAIVQAGRDGSPLRLEAIERCEGK